MFNIDDIVKFKPNNIICKIVSINNTTSIYETYDLSCGLNYIKKENLELINKEDLDRQNIIDKQKLQIDNYIKQIESLEERFINLKADMAVVAELSK